MIHRRGIITISRTATAVVSGFLLEWSPRSIVPFCSSVSLERQARSLRWKLSQEGLAAGGFSGGDSSRMENGTTAFITDSHHHIRDNSKLELVSHHIIVHQSKPSAFINIYWFMYHNTRFILHILVPHQYEFLDTKVTRNCYVYG